MAWALVTKVDLVAASDQAAHASQQGDCITPLAFTDRIAATFAAAVGQAVLVRWAKLVLALRSFSATMTADP